MCVTMVLSFDLADLFLDAVELLHLLDELGKVSLALVGALARSLGAGQHEPLRVISAWP